MEEEITEEMANNFEEDSIEIEELEEEEKNNG